MWWSCLRRLTSTQAKGHRTWPWPTGCASTGAPEKVAQLIYRCYAKINLTLEVLRRRDDGYHELASLVHTIGLADDLHIEPADELLTRAEGLDVEPEANLIARTA